MASVLLRYLIVKLKILASSLLCAQDQSELRFFKELAKRNDMISPCDGNSVWILSLCSVRIDFRIHAILL